MRCFLISCAALSLCLGGCETPNHRYLNGQPVADQTFSHIQPLRVGVEKVEIVNRSGMAIAPEDFIFSLPDQAVLYLSRKFEALGGTGRLLLRVEEANVRKTSKASGGRMLGALGVGGEDEYVLLMRLSVERRGGGDEVLYGKAVRAEQRFFVSEHTSRAGRERAQLRAIEALFRALDPKIDSIIRQDMGL